MTDLDADVGLALLTVSVCVRVCFFSHLHLEFYFHLLSAKYRVSVQPDVSAGVIQERVDSFSYLFIFVPDHPPAVRVIVFFARVQPLTFPLSTVLMFEC